MIPLEVYRHGGVNTIQEGSLVEHGRAPISMLEGWEPGLEVKHLMAAG